MNDTRAIDFTIIPETTVIDPENVAAHDQDEEALLNQTTCTNVNMSISVNESSDFNENLIGKYNCHKIS